MTYLPCARSPRFLLVSPRRLLSGKHEKLWVSLSGYDRASTPPITINLLHPDTNLVVSTTKYNHNGKYTTNKVVFF